MVMSLRDTGYGDGGDVCGSRGEVTDTDLVLNRFKFVEKIEHMLLEIRIYSQKRDGS